MVATDGGRYDVNVVKREKTAVYWEERNSVVRRCSWFSKGPADSYFIPYEENVAAKLEVNPQRTLLHRSQLSFVQIQTQYWEPIYKLALVKNY